MAQSEVLGDWVFEGMLQFLRSPLWNVPIQSFIEQNCGTFKPEEEENKLEYTEIHNKFRQLVDDLLTTFLTELGASPEAFVEAVKNGTCPELSEMITEYIVALDDFRSFRAMMEKRNIEMELESMYETARMSAAMQQAGGVGADLDEQERFLLEMAIHASLTEHDVIVKRLEKEDAELLQALAMSIALEQERMMLEQMRQQTGEIAKQIEAESKQNLERMKAEVHEKRIENIERGARELASVPAEAPPQSVPPPAEVAASSSPAKPVVPSVVPAPVATAPLQPAPAPVSAPAPTGLAPMQGTTGRAPLAPGLAPVSDRRSGAVFGAKPLPFGSGAAQSAQPLPPAPAEPPKLKDLAAQKAPEVAQAVSQPSEEEMARRKAYLEAQRERLKQLKEQSRQTELANFVAGQQNAGSQESAQPASAAPSSAPLSEEELRQQRIAFARRFKEDLIEETRKASRRVE